jgi:hypothetical protein
MRIGLVTIRLLALAAAGFASGDLAAQMGGAPTGPMQALYSQPMGGGGGYSNQWVDAYGAPAVVPASYNGGYGGDYAYGDCGCAPAGDCYGDCGCGDCGSGNCGCGGGHQYGGYGYGGSWQDCRSGTCPPFPDDVENYSMLPPGRTEQCGPHYWDVRMEAIMMTRDEAFRQNVEFTRLGFSPPEQLVLSSQELDFDWEAGFRIMGRYDCGPLSVIEFGYWGLQNLDASASFTDPTPDPQNPNTGSLYSLFSDYVRDPAALPPGVVTPNGPLPWTERSITHTISLESELHNAEFNYRRYWVGFNPKVSGTLLAGFRYTRLREDFRFQAVGEEIGTYDENIKNDMAGFQTGGDVWLHVRQGLRIGAEGKVGLMNNHYTLVNTFSTSNDALPPDFSESFEKDQPALTVEASADVVWDVCPSWSIRAGYECLFLNSVLLAGENFNTGTVYNDIPGVLLPERVPFVNNQGDAFYHGAHLGAEYVW